MASTCPLSFCNCLLYHYETSAANLHEEHEEDSELQVIHVNLKFSKINVTEASLDDVWNTDEELMVDCWIDISQDDVRNMEESMVLTLKDFLTDMGVSVPHHTTVIFELARYIETVVLSGERFASCPNVTVVEMNIEEVVEWEENNYFDEAVTRSLEVNTHVKTEPASEAAIANLEKVQVQDRQGGDQETLFCAICYGSEDGMDFVSMSCPKAFHAFHGDCLATWLRIDASCPLCRHRLPS